MTLSVLSYRRFGGERPYVDPDISGTHHRLAIGRLIKEHALSQGLSRPEYLPQHRSPWWPFASVSDGKGEGRKAFTAEKLRQVVRSYNAYYNLQDAGHQQQHHYQQQHHHYQPLMQISISSQRMCSSLLRHHQQQ
ncbi:hypothetical protein AALO_G00046590 [Alosa alosa]|uniref:Uncharacterized protein n=1 Tax=Alosa alosa TaxID=278164 RepID=A0AAV6H9F0_9TELE|nr:hypothetical protein AALO_G00046590 [Alosa alosa]